MGFCPENIEFWNPDFSLHIHLGRCLQTHSLASIFCPPTASLLIRTLVKSWMPAHWNQFPDPSFLRASPDSPPLFATWHPPSAHSSPPSPPLSAMDPEPRIQSMAFFIRLKQQEGRFLPRQDALIRKNSASLKKNSETSNRPELSEDPIPLGLHLSTWYQNRTVLGDHVETTAV